MKAMIAIFCAFLFLSFLAFVSFGHTQTMVCTPVASASSASTAVVYTFTCTVTPPVVTPPPPPPPVAPTIVLAAIPAGMTTASAPFSVSATSNSPAAITYAVVSGPATVSGSTVTITGAGTIVLSASQAATGNYTAASVTASVVVAAVTPPPPPPPPTPSANCTIGQSVVDSASNVWTVVGGVVMENGVAAGYSANVTELAYVNGLVYQKATSVYGTWWNWNGTTWVGDSADPTANNCGTTPPVLNAYVVNLTWTAPATSLDPVAGYNVYRKTGSGAFALLNSAPLSSAAYADSAVTDGVTYVYQVTSVDANGAASTPSNQYTAAVPAS